jgi:uncharacterized protein
MTGTFLNAGAILGGALLGSLVGGRLHARVRTTLTDLLGLFVVVLGIADALETFGDTLEARLGSGAVLVVLGSLLLGGILGELLDLERRFTWLGERLRDAVLRGPTDLDLAAPTSAEPAEQQPGRHGPLAGRHRFVEGFVITSLLVCVGPLSVLGPIQDGLTGTYQLLTVKAALDGFAALAFASALGVGVAFAAVPLLLYQGAITVAASAVGPYVTDPMLAAITSVGGFLVIAIGLRLLEVRAVRVANLLPALLLAPLAVAFLP